MPMVALVASGTIFSVNGSGISAGAATRLITTATVQPPAKGSNIANDGGFFGLYWSYVTTAVATGAASAQIPVFTWYDANISAGMTATGGVFGGLINGGTTSTITGNTSAVYGLSGTVSSILRGCEYFVCGSGASGASAYIQVSSVANNPSANAQAYRFDYRLFNIDNWAI